MSDLAPRSNSTVWQIVVVLFNKDKTNFKLGVYIVNIDFLRVLLDCGSILCIGETLVAETLSIAREIRRST